MSTAALYLNDPNCTTTPELVGTFLPSTCNNNSGVDFVTYQCGSFSSSATALLNDVGYAGANCTGAGGSSAGYEIYNSGCASYRNNTYLSGNCSTSAGTWAVVQYSDSACTMNSVVLLSGTVGCNSYSVQVACGAPTITTSTSGATSGSSSAASSSSSKTTSGSSVLVISSFLIMFGFVLFF